MDPQEISLEEAGGVWRGAVKGRRYSLGTGGGGDVLQWACCRALTITSLGNGGWGEGGNRKGGEVMGRGRQGARPQCCLFVELLQGMSSDIDSMMTG